jgi:hypothetical protein
MKITYQMRSLNQKTFPVLMFNNMEGLLPKFTVPITGFKKPDGPKQAIQFAVQAINRFFERYVGDPRFDKGHFSESLLRHRRAVRDTLRPMIDADLSNATFEDQGAVVPQIDS